MDCLSHLNVARGRSFNSLLPPLPPLSTVMKPPHQGYTDKKKKTKPGKEESNSEEVGEESEEEITSQMQQNGNESVAISPPPEGASIAEAKPIGLAIAGPGGIAASKPQGTAVVGAGGLAIARPVGTAIAGVEVEGSVPIGGQHKNKKKPKQDKETPDGELHYTGGLTGPIGHPQPIRKHLGDSASFKSFLEEDGSGSNIQDSLFFQGRQNNHGFLLRLGQKDGKYGFLPDSSSDSKAEDSGSEPQRVEAPAYFHGPVGDDGQNVHDHYSARLK